LSLLLLLFDDAAFNVPCIGHKDDKSHDDAELVSHTFGRPPSWISKLNYLVGCALETHHAKFCGDQSYCCKDIAIFRVFQVKCKNSLDDRS